MKAIGCALLLVGGLAACAGRSAEAEAPPSALLTAFEATPPPIGLGADAARAYRILLEARTFDSTRVGVAGALSPHVAAFRVLVRDPGARSAFVAMLRDGSPAGRLYALSGIYFAAPEAFDEAVRWLARSDSEVVTVSGCILGRRTLGSVVRDPRGIRMRAGSTLDDVDGPAPMDIAGGYVPMTFVDEDGTSRAPRGPAR